MKFLTQTLSDLDIVQPGQKIIWVTHLHKIFISILSDSGIVGLGQVLSCRCTLPATDSLLESLVFSVSLTSRRWPIFSVLRSTVPVLLNRNVSATAWIRRLYPIDFQVTKRCQRRMWRMSSFFYVCSTAKIRPCTMTRWNFTKNPGMSVWTKRGWCLLLTPGGTTWRCFVKVCKKTALFCEWARTILMFYLW